jgi:hypothetical protein
MICDYVAPRSINSSQNDFYVSSDEESATNDADTTYSFASIIYFNEKGTPIYCVKTESLFALLQQN